jgi:phytoene synthase
MKELFDKVSINCSRITTLAYSTSFSMGIRCLSKELRDPIYSIYGFVRFADEIVDTFHDYDKSTLLEHFKEETYRSIHEKISLNPILNSFQFTVRRYHIEQSLIEQFLKSMEMDLALLNHNTNTMREYIVGSAEVVGLMCLRVFCNDRPDLYEDLKPYAMRLGAAFQKVNFLRDLQSDFVSLGRTYFPGIQVNAFDERSKKQIEESIKRDFDEGFKGIKKLPRAARFGVYVAYVYYLALFKKIKNTPSQLVLRTRISIRRRHKVRLLAYSFLKHQLNIL